MIDLVATFIVFFSVIDPIGTVPVFIAVTRQYDEGARKRIARLAAIVAAGVLLFFVAVGEKILNAMSVPLAAFQVAGGIVLFMFALSMIFGESKPDEECRIVENHDETAIYPLAVPSIAGPGAMLTAVLMTETARVSAWEQVQIAMVMLSVLVLTYFMMLGAGRINKVIGNGGASVVSRVMGLILTSVAAANTLAGIKSYFDL